MKKILFFMTISLSTLLCASFEELSNACATNNSPNHPLAYSASLSSMSANASPAITRKERQKAKKHEIVKKMIQEMEKVTVAKTEREKHLALGNESRQKRY